MAKRLSEDFGRVVTPEEAYARRHESDEMRMKWYIYLNQYREGDPTRLLRECLIESDLICGPRDGTELRQAQKDGLIDLTVWIENPEVPPDKTVTFTINDADVVIRNPGMTSPDGKLYFKRLYNLARSLNVLRPGVEQPS